MSVRADSGPGLEPGQPTTDSTRFVLASASPRRREILETLGLAFDVHPSDASEAPRADEPPNELPVRLAVDKALSVSRASGERFVLGADTVVVRDGRALGKPADVVEAAAMVSALAGGWHEVHTGVALARRGAVIEARLETTRVCFATLDRETIERYAASREGLDKAGAYAIQGLGAGLVARIEGSYTNVVGLPAELTLGLLRRHGVVGAWP